MSSTLLKRMKTRRFVLGDIHGRVEALRYVLTTCNFDFKKDRIIILGDIVDGGYNTYEVVEVLLRIKNKILILGNHDKWFIDHIRSGWAGEIWLHQGGNQTMESYAKQDYNIPVTHQELFNQAKLYHVEDNMLFVHGGINPAIPKLESQSEHDLLWDRHLIEYAKTRKVEPYEAVFVGHSTTQMQGSNPKIKDCLAPIWYNNLCMMDCGAGWTGKLAIMDIDTKKYWVSPVQEQAAGRYKIGLKGEW